MKENKRNHIITIRLNDEEHEKLQRLAGDETASSYIRRSGLKSRKEIQIISSTTIAKLIEAHKEGNEEKFDLYANYIADVYEQNNEERSAKIIRSRLDGSYQNESKVTLSGEE